MFRLVDDGFGENSTLHNLAVYCLTETIKSHLESFFDEDYKIESEKNLYTKVKLDKVVKLLPRKLLKEMENTGVNYSSFIPKKIAEFMLLLTNKEEKTPDLFLEYILYRMICKQSKIGIDTIPRRVEEKKPELKKLLRPYADDVLGIDNAKERNTYVKETTMLLTEFTKLLGIEEADDHSLTFWDWDCFFFDDWGFRNVIKQSAYGILAQRGYGLEYTRSIFTSVGEEVPNILK